MRFMSGFLFLGSAALFLVVASAYAADQPVQKDKKPPAGEKPFTVTYDVSDIVAKRSYWESNGQRVDVMEGLAKSILGYIPAQNFLGKTPLHTIQFANRKTLEIHTDNTTHEQIKNVLQAYRRSLDLALVVNCRLYEVDRKTYDRHIAEKKPRHPGNPAVFVDPTTEETERKFLEGKAGDDKPFYLGLKPLKASKVTIQDREQGEIFSWRTAVPYERSPGGGRFVKKGEKESAFAAPGFSFSMAPVVSADRRYTQIKLTQKVTQLLEWKKEKALELLQNQDFKEVFFEVPVLQESSFTSTFTAFDDWPIVAAVQGPRPGVRDHDRPLVLLFSARILIEEEERAIQKGLEEEKKKKK